MTRDKGCLNKAVADVKWSELSFTLYVSAIRTSALLYSFIKDIRNIYIYITYPPTFSFRNILSSVGEARSVCIKIRCYCFIYFLKTDEQ